ncbi:unnamed protein product [Meganyctiphanes norvegica]|uniref:Uncharacterized protein n=1 Tax=Meganyctiphanes norvegica TaxID=48144 RepID=A0AAV2QUP1_MEGNR
MLACVLCSEASSVNRTQLRVEKDASLAPEGTCWASAAARVDAARTQSVTQFLDAHQAGPRSHLEVSAIPSSAAPGTYDGVTRMPAAHGHFNSPAYNSSV